MMAGLAVLVEQYLGKQSRAAVSVSARSWGACAHTGATGLSGMSACTGDWDVDIHVLTVAY